MADIQSLRARVEQINLNLKTAHAARQRESEALISLWEQIRTRFTRQEEELVALRRKSAELEDTKEELMEMVRTLLGAVEQSLQGIREDTAPRIARLAGDLLAAEPGEAPPPAAPPPIAAEAEISPAVASENPPQTSRTASTVGESLSPGIRALIARMDGALDGTAKKPNGSAVSADDEDVLADVGIPEPGDRPTADDPDDDLANDMHEIEKLRNELRGLRRRIAITDD